ncbi:MAG: hypothetical protein SGARI_004748 [Bacillariaceae sp.]
MAEGGTLAWKRQVIDESRGPAGSYSNMKLPDKLPDNNVAWQQNPETREWTLVRVDSKQQQHKFAKNKQKYKLHRCMAWNPHTGREQYSVRLKPIDYGDGNAVCRRRNKTSKDLDEEEEETVATTADDTVNTGDYSSANEYYFNEECTEDQSQNDDDDTPEPPVLGKDYVVHTVLDSDTFQGLLLRYKIKAIELRRVNQFSGTNLSLAPSHLIIPLNESSRSLQQIRLQDTDSREYKLQILLTEYPQLTATERKAYLEMNEWSVDAALQEVQNDLQWEEDEQDRRAREAMEVKVPNVTSLSLRDEDEDGSLAAPLLMTTTMQPLEVEEL